MWANLAIGTGVISLTVLLQTFGLVTLTRVMNGVVRWFRLHRHDFGKSVAMVTTVLGLFLIHTLEIWLWAVVFLRLHALPTIEEALYVSTATFSPSSRRNRSEKPATSRLMSVGFGLSG